MFLYSFGRSVQWPEAALGKPGDPFVIGILGRDPFGEALNEIAAKKTLQERRIVVRRFASVEEYREPCHILFVSGSVSSDDRAALLKKTEGKPVWIVGETPGFAQQGGMANFFLEGDHVRFEINPENARRAQLRLDAKLMSLGTRVGTPRPAASDRGPTPPGARRNALLLWKTIVRDDPQWKSTRT